MLTKSLTRTGRERRAELDHAPAALDERLSRLFPEWMSLASLLDAGVGVFTPAADVEETDDAYIVDVELPGVSRSDIAVELAGRVLTISGERKEKERAGILRRRTRVTGQFRYEVLLPAVAPDADVVAGYDDGVLVVRVAKSDADRPRRIPVH